MNTFLAVAATTVALCKLNSCRAFAATYGLRVKHPHTYANLSSIDTNTCKLIAEHEFKVTTDVISTYFKYRHDASKTCIITFETCKTPILPAYPIPAYFQMYDKGIMHFDNEGYCAEIENIDEQLKINSHKLHIYVYCNDELVQVLAEI